jgi:cyclic pyranopterin phosphate synthase
MEAQHTNNIRIPQLRVLLNTACGKRCRYCRPSGEASHQVQRDQQATPDELLEWVRVLVCAGVRDVRLTGGEPALHPLGELVRLVRETKAMGVPRLTLVTRNGRIASALAALKCAGLDCITFSLDTLDPVRWCRICGISECDVGEHATLLDAVLLAHEAGLPVSLNCVLLADTSAAEFFGLLEFAAKVGASVKVEELIRDVGMNGAAGAELHANPEHLAAMVRAQASSTWVTTPAGGLGHPMDNHRLPSGVTVTWKQFAKGACYGTDCHDCADFPCDDALMALRLLPDGRLQTCLKRDGNHLDLGAALRQGGDEADRMVRRALSVYATATRYEHADIERLRARRAWAPATQVLYAMEAHV